MKQKTIMGLMATALVIFLSTRTSSVLSDEDVIIVIFSIWTIVSLIDSR